MSSRDGMSPFRKDCFLKEQQRITKFAPRIRCKGPHIKNHEKLSRAVLFPDHLNPDGSLRVEGISRDDLTHRGFSVFRVKYTNRLRIDELIHDYLEKDSDRIFEFVLVFNVGAVRGIKSEKNIQEFIVLDDAKEPKDVGHAIILLSEKYKPAKVKELRRDLARIMNNHFHLDEVYPS